MPIPKKDMYGLPPGIITDPMGNGTLEALWWATLEPGMDDIYDKAGGDGGSLKPMQDRLAPLAFVNILKKGTRIFLAQYILSQDGTSNFNFMGGFQLDCIEMMIFIGEYSTKSTDVFILLGNPGIPPFPGAGKTFTWPDMGSIVFNKIYEDYRDKSYLPDGLTTKMFADSLGSEDPKGHWWFNCVGSAVTATLRHIPVPGEFMGLGVRIMFDKVWGDQKTSPFIYSGNFMDSVYYTSAVVLEVYPASNDVPYPTYLVQWHKYQVVAVPTDFAERRIGDRCTVLKSVYTSKTEQRWSDDDTQEWDGTWTLVPISFYDDGSGSGI